MDFDAARLLMVLPQGAVLVSLDGIVQAANGQAASELDVRPGELVGASLPDVMARRGLHGLESALEGMGTAGGDARLVSDAAGKARARVEAATARDGSLTGALVLFQPLPSDDAWPSTGDERGAALDPASRLVSYPGFRSQTELEAANEALQTLTEELRARLEQLREAERMNDRKNEFLAMLAHELRNPLAPLVSALYIIRERVPGEPAVRQALQIADRQVRHQTRLLDDLLDVSRLATDKIALSRSAVDLSTVVVQAIEAVDLSVRSQAHQLIFDRPAEPLTVYADPTRLEQVIGNLLSNAVKYTKAGGRITVTVVEAGGEAVLTVADTGVGIAPDVLSRVFDLFVQADASLARSQGGLGIGLTLVRRLVELHGGRVVARSEGPGLGSEFEVRLPLSRPRADAASRPDSSSRAAPRPLRVAIIEDNRDAREMLRMVLELQGHEVFEAADGAAGVQTVITNTPDVVLLDIGLPGLDGYQVARRLRRRLGSTIRLVALTGYSDPETRRATSASGFDAHLVKPVDPDELGRVLAALR